MKKIIIPKDNDSSIYPESYIEGESKYNEFGQFPVPYKDFNQSIYFSASKVKPATTMSYSSAKKTHYLDEAYNNPFSRTEAKNRNMNYYNGPTNSSFSYMKPGYENSERMDRINPYDNMDFLNIGNTYDNHTNNSFCHYDDRKSNIMSDRERKSLLDTIHAKDNEIRKLTSDINGAFEHCEKVIKETEDNFLNQKLQVKV